MVGTVEEGTTEKVRIVLAFKEQVEIRCLEGSSEGPESERTPW